MASDKNALLDPLLSQSLKMAECASDIAIRVSNLSKCYQIYDTPRDRLKQFALPSLQRMIGKQPKQYFRKFWALKDVSFEIKKGETIGIVGRNGSGKSTLLQIICGTLTPSAGSVETSGRISALLELGAGFNPEFTGRENVMLGASLAGISSKKANAMFESVAAFADIGEFIEQPIKTYSSGMFVRLAFALQIHTDPEVFLVDEAMAVGDHRFVQKCYARMMEMTAAGTSMLLVSHDTTAIKMLCDRALWLHKGELRMIGPATDVVDAYRQWVDGIDDAVVLSLAESKRDTVGRLQLEGLQMLDPNGKPCSAFMHGTSVMLEARIRNQSCPPGTRLRFGFSIRNNRGIEITGCNTDMTGFTAPAPKVGEALTLRAAFELPLLAGGRYSINTNVDAIKGADSVTEVLVRDGFVFDVDERVKVFTIIGLDALFSTSAAQTAMRPQEAADVD